VSGAVVGTSFGLVPIARQSLPDVPLAFFVSLGVWSVIQAVSLASTPASGVAGPRLSRRAWLLIASAATALGVLTKGPVALVLPAAVIIPVVLWERHVERAAHRAYRLPVTLADLGLATIVFCAISVPWYAAVTREEGVGYLHQFLVGENIDRFSTSRYNTWRGWDYVPIVVGGLLPWSAYGLLWVRSGLDVLAGRRRLTIVDIHLLAWALAPLAFFFVSVGSQPRYILPCLVPLSILLGRTVAARLGARDRLFNIATVLAGAVIAASGGLMWRAGPVLEAAGGTWSGVGASVVVAAGVLVVLSVFVLPRRLIPALTAMGGAAALFVFEQTFIAPGRPEPVEVIAEAARNAGLSSSVCACGAFARSLNFYTHAPTAIVNTDDEGEEVIGFLAAPERLLAVVDAKTLGVVERRLGRRLTRLREVSYLNTSLWQRPSFLVNPDRSAVQQVFLISSR
jgi:4-amino-4-deoxy-L-arabinose transferase-like glycosyltransferase